MTVPKAEKIVIDRKRLSMAVITSHVSTDKRKQQKLLSKDLVSLYETVTVF